MKEQTIIPVSEPQQTDTGWVVTGPNGEQLPYYGKITGTDLPRTRKKVAIVGFAPSTMRDVRALFDSNDFEIWGLNQLYVPFPRIAEFATRWFQIHHRHSYDHAVRDHKHHDWLVQQKFPIYMQHEEPDIPMSVRFPKEIIMDEFGDYFTNSISWMICLAILERFEEIHIYGVDMAQDEEYSEQRPSCEYYIGWARGMGIKVYVPAASDLLKAMWLYPYEDAAKMIVKMDRRDEELAQRAAELNQQEQVCRDQRMQIIGARENMRYMRRNFHVTAQENAVYKEHV